MRVVGTVRLLLNVWESSRGLASPWAFWRLGEAKQGQCGVAQVNFSIWRVWTGSHELPCFDACLKALSNRQFTCTWFGHVACAERQLRRRRRPPIRVRVWYFEFACYVRHTDYNDCVVRFRLSEVFQGVRVLLNSQIKILRSQNKKVEHLTSRVTWTTQVDDTSMGTRFWLSPDRHEKFLFKRWKRSVKDNLTLNTFSIIDSKILLLWRWHFRYSVEYDYLYDIINCFLSQNHHIVETLGILAKN